MKQKISIYEMLEEARHYHNCLCDEEEAIKICEQVLEKDPENIDALLIKAGSLPHINKEKEAFQLTESIIEKWPNHWEAYYLMGVLLFNTNENMAMQNFNKSISLKKTFDNSISAAQLSYFLKQPDYKRYLSYAKEIDPSRYARYMKNCWEWEVC